MANYKGLDCIMGEITTMVSNARPPHDQHIYRCKELKGERKMLGRFASMRNDYLRENKPVLYEQMIRDGKLKTHLEETDADTRRTREQLIEQLLKENPAPERKYQLEWVRHMNSLKHAAEEIVIAELICM